MRRFIPLCIVALLLPFAALGQARTEEAKHFVDSLGREVLNTINTGGEKRVKQEKLQTLFTNYVDIDWMGKFVLGRAWATASQTQRQQYLQAYRAYLLDRYTSNFADYSGSDYVITGAKEEANGQILVNMKVKSPKARQQETLAGYRLHLDENGQLQIVDIIIEGVSLLTTQRSDFSAVAQRNGMDKLIQQLQAKAQNPA